MSCSRCGVVEVVENEHGGFVKYPPKYRGHYVTHLGGIKQYKSMVIFGDFPYYNALFGLVI